MRKCNVKCAVCIDNCKNLLLYKICNSKKDDIDRHCSFQKINKRYDSVSSLKVIRDFLKKNYPKHYTFLELTK